MRGIGLLFKFGDVRFVLLDESLTCCASFIEIKYGSWSEILVNNIPTIHAERRWEHLHRKLSMRV